MKSSNAIGSEFEMKIRDLLHDLHKSHPSLVSFTEKEPLSLQNGEVVFPDFHLIVNYPAERRHYLIECQNRMHYTHSILHKIQHVRAKQAFKTFFFVYPKVISPELARAMDQEGIVHRNLEEFGSFLGKISDQLAFQPKEPVNPVQCNYNPPDYAMCARDYGQEAKEKLLQHPGELFRSGKL